jgi:hypothetical protein
MIKYENYFQAIPLTKEAKKGKKFVDSALKQLENCLIHRWCAALMGENKKYRRGKSRCPVCGYRMTPEAWDVAYRTAKKEGYL